MKLTKLVPENVKNNSSADIRTAPSRIRWGGAVIFRERYLLSFDQFLYFAVKIRSDLLRFVEDGVFLFRLGDSSRS